MDQPALLAHDVSIKPSEENVGKELSETFYRNCSFCNKLVKITSFNFKSCLNLSGKRFFCAFCLRHHFHYRSSRHVLIFSYRAIIGHYYYKHYLRASKCFSDKLWISEIQQKIDYHIQIGLCSPVFCYDPDTYLWFVDFAQIGKSSRKAPFKEVLETVRLMLYCFNLQKIYSKKVFIDMWEKYEKAITSFYTHRKRPAWSRMLIPTLKGVSISHSNEEASTRNFVPAMLQGK